MDQISVILNSAVWEELVYITKYRAMSFFGEGGWGCKKIVAKKRTLDDKENLIQNKLDSQLFHASDPKYYLHKVRG